MRVAIVAESFLPNMNGVTNSILRVLEHLERGGHDAMVVAPDNPAGKPRADVEHGRVPVNRVPAVMVPKVSSLPVGVPGPGLTATIRAFEPDVVHLASPFLLGAGGLAAANRIGVPAVAVYQTDVAGFAESYGLGLTSKAAWRWTRRVHRGAARTLAPSSSAVEALEHHGVPRVHRWARGVDAVRFAPSARRETLRRRWSPDGKMIIGFVGRLAPEKHVERLASIADDVQLVVVGDGPERHALEKLMPSAIFLGQLGGDELAQAYASFDVFVHPGEHETFCQAVQEALASGIPVIGPDAGGPRDLITHCRNGYLLPVDRFAELLPSAVAALRSPVTRARFGEAARKSVLHRTWPAICDELLGHYDDVLGWERRRTLRTA
ncbi:glycosyltransferase family 1 protein [Rhodococcus sp. BP-252]|uniref:glycosyltransferase family 4 protein n=1 Tax=unclassified Rhodococcus (in: high G+C Gram-positive bacteria) TaxID=192944 RepID=UPI001C9B4B99|nr:MULTISPECIES: glycosyltransferase family 1 protein [unclassified Rhodococcus (in: high G+C Gram-positive bacteria)]MBY6413578.1 glycosyltransferase family 1 protein [Rhodococcus sp. BP-320]MBY6418226.1 glycosyltransferase family 1 protein [Rhodococcus sp. BP-321]MBY6422640.1 glycosyltransferase family 1 protein [Rhodococcus sp. BP-324]MBY6428171.1 glycosyltransferase family 1 protein [Rhodococcus sp. BP-323]MBY6433349.1 glycosyltransferase family 1 protein [Rhodococcus sp. BP-322]